MMIMMMIMIVSDNNRQSSEEDRKCILKSVVKLRKRYRSSGKYYTIMKKVVKT